MVYSVEQITNYQNEFNSTIANLKDLVSDRIMGNFKNGHEPHMQYIRIDALDTKDYPHQIESNSIFITFSINFETKKVELHSYGHVYLSPKDLRTPKYQYYAMKSIVNVGVDKGVKKFRKCGFKDSKLLAQKLATYYNDIMICVKEYTGGIYPYKQGIEK